MKVVVLCSGNRFRSPFVAALLRKRLSERGVDVRSCGTLDLGGAPALRSAVRIAKRAGIDLDEHTSRALRRGELGDADLILGFERLHVATARVEGGAREEISFTLSELVSLLRQIGPAQDPQAKIAAAAELRRRDPRPAAEVADPAGRARWTQRRIGRELQALTDELAERLFES